MYDLHWTDGWKFGSVLFQIELWNQRMLKKTKQHNQPCFKTATLDLNLKWTEPHYFTGCLCFTLKTQKYKVKSLYTGAPGFQRFSWILRVVCELTSCGCSESLEQVGSKYLEVNFHRLGFIILKRFFMKTLKRKKKNFDCLVLLHIFWWPMSVLN